MLALALLRRPRVFYHYYRVALVVAVAAVAGALQWHDHNPLVVQSLQYRDVAITPSYIRGPFNLSIALQRGRSVDPALNVQHLGPEQVLIVDRRADQFQLYGLSPSSIVYWAQPLTVPATAARHCTLQVFYNALFQRQHGDVDVLLLAVIDGVNAIYGQTGLGLTFNVLNPIVALPVAAAAIANDTLRDFAAFTAQLAPAVCSHLLFDGMRYPNGLVGLAYLNRSGQATYNNALVAWPSNPAVLVLVAAHELAHGLGANHDGTRNSCGGQGCLMEPVLDLASTRFSSCSLQAMAAWVDQTPTLNGTLYEPGPRRQSMYWLIGPVFFLLAGLALLGWYMSFYHLADLPPKCPAM